MCHFDDFGRKHWKQVYLRLKCSVKQKEKRSVEKECFNFWNKSQAAELPEKGKLFPGRANHGVKPVPNLGSTAARVGRDLTLPSSPLCGLLSCCSEDHNGYRFQPPCLYSTKYPFLHPLHFSPLGWQFTYPYCSFPRDRVSAYAKRKLPCSLGEGLIPHGSWKDAAIGILDPEMCSVVTSGWPQHKGRNAFWPRLLKEGMCLNPRRFPQPPAETGNRGLGRIFFHAALLITRGVGQDPGPLGSVLTWQSRELYWKEQEWSHPSPDVPDEDIGV